MVGSHFLWESWFRDVSSEVQTGWSLAACWVFFFPCVHAADWVGGWMPFAESQGQVTGTLSPSDSWCAAKLQRSLKPNRCPLLCVLGLGGWLGSSLSLSLTGTAWSLSLSLTCVHVYVCVCIHRTQSLPLLYTPVAISLRLVPTHTIKAL